MNAPCCDRITNSRLCTPPPARPQYWVRVQWSTAGGCLVLLRALDDTDLAEEKSPKKLCCQLAVRRAELYADLQAAPEDAKDELPRQWITASQELREGPTSGCSEARRWGSVDSPSTSPGGDREAGGTAGATERQESGRKLSNWTVVLENLERSPAPGSATADPYRVVFMRDNKLFFRKGTTPLRKRPTP